MQRNVRSQIKKSQHWNQQSSTLQTHEEQKILEAKKLDLHPKYIQGR